MTRRLWISLGWVVLVTVGLVGLPVIPPQGQSISGWTTIVPGIAYRVYRLPDPNTVYVARMDRHHPDVTLESAIGMGTLTGGVESVRGMADRYNQALSFWGESWGARSEVIVAINGSYFDMRTGLAQEGVIQSGWYSKRFSDLGGWSGFAWKLDGSASIGDCVYNRPEKQIITYANGLTQRIDDLNVARGSDELILYTPQYSTHTGTEDGGVEVLVELDQPGMIMPTPSGVMGIIREISVDRGATIIPFDHIVLSAQGRAAETLLSNASPGDPISLSQEITGFDSDCATPLDFDWTKTYASIGGAFHFLKDGNIRNFPADLGATQRHPRTAIAYNEDYIFFIVVDGRDMLHSLGMTIQELALFIRDTLGATDGVAEDGGGSSTMVVKGRVMNNTACNLYSCNYVLLPLVVAGLPLGKEAALYNELQAQIQLVTPPHTGNLADQKPRERSVANGMMMVVVKPKQQSYTFDPGDWVVTRAQVDLRQGPGTNYALLSTITRGIGGVILEHAGGLNGILAKGSYWWKVDFGGVVGWVPEEALDPVGGGW